MAVELSSFHSKDPTYPGSVEARALDFRFRLVNSIYKLFEHGEKQKELVILK
jgi:hypothetical protein